jgi:hypothetical protein
MRLSRPQLVVAMSALVLATALPRAQAPQAAPLGGWSVAFPAVDGTVVVLIDEGGELYVPQREFDAMPALTTTAATRPGRLVELPASLIPQLVGDKAHVGDPWTIDLPQSGRIHATVERFVLGYRNCGEAWGVALRPVSADRNRLRSTGVERALARPGVVDALPDSTVGPLTRALTPGERMQVTRLLEQARLDTIADVRRQWKESEPRVQRTREGRAWLAKWTALDAALDSHEGRVSFDATLYDLTPDAEPRAFVRAHWTAKGSVAYAMTMWVRVSSHVTVESVDAHPAWALRDAETGIFDWSRVMPEVLAVFDVNGDGRAEVLMKFTGYENIDQVLIEYPASPAEKPRDLVRYGDGC